MNDENPVSRDALLETFAAELSFAAYRVVLQTRPQGTWLDLELALWRAIAERVKSSSICDCESDTSQRVQQGR